MVTVELPIVSVPPVVSLCEHNKGTPPGGVKSIGQRPNSEGSPVTLAREAVAKASDIESSSIAASPMIANLEWQ
jgi:hypothetical protein